MPSVQRIALKRFQTLYLNPDGADVWFIFDGERIPAHKLLLTTMSPWMKTMFLGSLPEGDEVDMTHSNVTAAAFKEFLRFMYLDKANLTMENIAGVMDLAKQSMVDGIFGECEEFLMKSVTTDTMCFGYQLALLYSADRLKAICEGEICVNAEQTLRSSSFLNFQYDFLHNILKCDALACEEKYIFDACIAWAKAACVRNNRDASNVAELRSQLKDSLYQIRFISMSKEEAAACISSLPGLFSADELEEIICMVGHSTDYKPNKFNWQPRYYNLQWDKGRRLMCNRFLFSLSRFEKPYIIKEVETTSFTCNQRVLLNGFSCEHIELCNRAANIQITEKRSDDPCKAPIERFNEQLTLSFENKQIISTKNSSYFSYKANVKLNKAILLRPKHVYEIRIAFEKDLSESTESDEAPPHTDHFNRCVYKSKILLDLDIMIRFKGHLGIVSQLSLSRFDRKRYFQKIVSSPKAWFS